jgi:hypothetical protein
VYENNLCLILSLVRGFPEWLTSIGRAHTLS